MCRRTLSTSRTALFPRFLGAGGAESGSSAPQPCRSERQHFWQGRSGILRCGGYCVSGAAWPVRRGRRVQAAFDLMGIPHRRGDYRSSAMVMDKAITKVMMESAGILTPKWQEFTYTAADIPVLCQSIACPCVIKVVTGGSSLGVQVVDRAEQLPEALTLCLKYGNHVVVEEKITGRETDLRRAGRRVSPCSGDYPLTRRGMITITNTTESRGNYAPALSLRPSRSFWAKLPLSCIINWDCLFIPGQTSC